MRLQMQGESCLLSPPKPRLTSAPLAGAKSVDGAMAASALLSSGKAKPTAAAPVLLSPAAKAALKPSPQSQPAAGSAAAAYAAFATAPAGDKENGSDKLSLGIKS